MLVAGILVTEELAGVMTTKNHVGKFVSNEKSISPKTPERGVEANRKTPAQVRCCVQSKPGAHPRGLRAVETLRGEKKKRREEL